MAIIWPRSNSFEFDANGTRAPGAKLYFYDAGTSTPKAAYEDAALGTAYTQPVTADGNGRWPSVFLDYGAYKERATTSGGTTLWTADNIPNTAPTDPGDGVDADSIFKTGQIILWLTNDACDGFVRCNGDSIGSATSGATERANADCEDLFTLIWNGSTTLRASVSGGAGASAAADWAANKTIPLPDGRGAGLVGFDDMGATDSGNSDGAPVISGSSILAGSLIGANTHAILEAQLPTHAHGVSITSAAGSAHTHGTGTFATSGAGAHTHTGTTGTESVGLFPHYNAPTSKVSTHAAGGADSNWNGADVDTAGPQLSTHTHSFLTTSDPGNHTHSFTGSLASESAHTHAVSGNTGNIGSSTAHNIMSRSLPVTVLMKL